MTFKTKSLPDLTDTAPVLSALEKSIKEVECFYDNHANS